jgi:hypothetical protein
MLCCAMLRFALVRYAVLRYAMLHCLFTLHLAWTRSSRNSADDNILRDIEYDAVQRSESVIRGLGRAEIVRVTISYATLNMMQCRVLDQ